MIPNIDKPGVVTPINLKKDLKTNNYLQGCDDVLKTKASRVKKSYKPSMKYKF